MTFEPGFMYQILQGRKKKQKNKNKTEHTVKLFRIRLD